MTGTPMPNGKAVCEEEEEESHGDDPALQRTGRLVVQFDTDIIEICNNFSHIIG